MTLNYSVQSIDTQNTLYFHCPSSTTHSLPSQNCLPKICRTETISISCSILIVIIRHFNTIILVYFFLNEFRRHKVISDELANMNIRPTIFFSFLTMRWYRFSYAVLWMLCVIFIFFFVCFLGFYYYLHDQYAYWECLEICFFLLHSLKEDRKASSYIWNPYSFI